MDSPSSEGLLTLTELTPLEEASPSIEDEDCCCFDTEDEGMVVIAGDQTFLAAGGGGGGGGGGVLSEAIFGAGGCDENFGLLEGPPSNWVDGGAGGAGGGGRGLCLMDGIMACLMSGEEAESRDFGEVLFENGTAVAAAGLPLATELWRETGV